MTEQLAHAVLGASSMYRWSACPGSVRVSKGIRSASSVYAQEGTAAHALGTVYLADWKMHGNRARPMAEYVGRILNSGDFPGADSIVPIEEDMLEAVKVYTDHIAALLASVQPGEMHVVDYKHGAGIPVEVTDNPQLRYYGLGALVTVPVSDGKQLLLEHRFDLSSVYPGCFGTADAVVVGAGHPSKITLHIVQPRCNHADGPIRQETLDAVDLLDFRADLVNFAKATENENAVLLAGDHCRFCPGAAVCPELHKKATEVAKLEFSAALPYDPATLRTALDSRDILKAWLKALDEFAYREAEAGRCPPDYKLVAKRATRKWKNEAAAIEFLQDAGFTPSQIYERSLKSPPQIETLFPKKAIPETLPTLYESISSGHTLVHVSDKRPAVKPNAAEEFQPVPNQSKSNVPTHALFD